MALGSSSVTTFETCYSLLRAKPFLPCSPGLWERANAASRQGQEGWHFAN